MRTAAPPPQCPGRRPSPCCVQRLGDRERPATGRKASERGGRFSSRGRGFFLSACPHCGDGNGFTQLLTRYCALAAAPLASLAGIAASLHSQPHPLPGGSSTRVHGGRALDLGEGVYGQGRGWRAADRRAERATGRAGLPCSRAQHVPSAVLQSLAVPSSLPVSRRCPSGLRLSQLMPPRWSAQTLRAEPPPPRPRVEGDLGGGRAPLGRGPSVSSRRFPAVVSRGHRGATGSGLLRRHP